MRNRNGRSRASVIAARNSSAAISRQYSERIATETKAVRLGRTNIEEAKSALATMTCPAAHVSPWSHSPHPRAAPQARSFSGGASGCREQRRPTLVGERSRGGRAAP